MSPNFIRAAPYADDAMNLPVENVAAAIPFYEDVMGFQIVSRSDQPHNLVVLGRDEVRIGLAENGGDPSQEGCFFEVDDVQAVFEQLKSNGLNQENPSFRVDKYGGTSYRVFFVVAPDGLCYCIGQRQP